MEGAYHPTEVETHYERWEREGHYNACAKSAMEAKQPPFVMVIPPPNVTGSLHLGHALTFAIQDCIIRHHRMNGREVLWVPGTDHAGIATQSVVEKTLQKTLGLSRYDIGREGFIKKVWEWKEEYGDRICQQLRKMGASVDWTREAFTMDTVRSAGVTEAFVRLFDKGLIQRKLRLVSWSSHLRTALSDVEVDTIEISKPERIRVPGFEKTVEVGVLWYFKYPVKSMPGRFIEVATTRIETMLGDVAVAVNPKDERYADLVGQELEHPYFPERKMVVIADDYVSLEYGTGAVKITPAHDKNDYEMGLRHGLPMVTCFDLDGNISIGEWTGVHRFLCRVEIEKNLAERGLLGQKVPNTNNMSIPLCGRSGDIIEYQPAPQWYMDCTEAAADGLKAVEEGRLTIKPESHIQTWRHWLDNIQPWCISRQLWWGHQIPAYKIVSPVLKEEKWVAARNMQEAEARGRVLLGLEYDEVIVLKQDEDVLDTWFSSGLFPFTTMGWPERTPDMEAFFPGSLLETGHDILFFWVARMCFMSFYLFNGTLPFKEIYLHAMVRDSHGKKMSKSLGNVIDPLHCISGISLQKLTDNLQLSSVISETEKKRALTAQNKEFPNGIPECGADGLRMGLLAYLKQGRSINLDVNRVVGYRQFCNKLWNAVKFALLYFDDEFRVPNTLKLVTDDSAWYDVWVLDALRRASKSAHESCLSYEFADMVLAVYRFWLYELCDVYLEILKVVFRGDDKKAKQRSQGVLWFCLSEGLKMLHPIQPFVTETLFGKLPRGGSIIENTKHKTVAFMKYPTGDFNVGSDHQVEEAVRLFNLFSSILKQTRSLKELMELRITLPLIIQTDEKQLRESDIPKICDALSFMARVEVSMAEAVPEGAVIDTIRSGLVIAVVCPPETDFSKMALKLTKRSDALEKSLSSLIKKMSAASYVERVPADIREADALKRVQLEKDVPEVKNTLERVKSMLSK